MSALAMSGCGAITRDVAAEVPEPFIHESLRTLAQDDTQALVSELVSLPEVRAATRDLVASVTDGSLDALAEPERAERLGSAVEQFVARIVAAIADAADREVAPVVVATIERSVDAALREALSRESRDRISEATSEIAERTVASAAIAARDEMGPALRAVLADPETRQVLRDTAREISREVARGSGEAMREARARAVDSDEPAGLFAEGARMLERGSALLDLLFAVVVLGALALAVLRVRRTRRNARREERARRREVVVMSLLARAARGGGELSPELARALDRLVREAEEDAGEPRPRGGSRPQPA